MFGLFGGRGILGDMFGKDKQQGNSFPTPKGRSKKTYRKRKPMTYSRQLNLRFNKIRLEEYHRRQALKRAGIGGY